ncbi:hypothetical protein DY000_02058924 [Brassica cretica]|uniref:DUF1985 domain-containing protein n=1 Tax=Brassica cretica TaxID=69181 RepID=A0ABQ7AX97_BRACR|nr:hypothetical protein DY000_02058924 [Brassica cretica]
MSCGVSLDQFIGLNCEYIEDLERPHCVVTKELTSFWEMLGVHVEAGPSTQEIITAFERCEGLARLVMELERFENYPWGRVAFKVLMDSVKGRDISGCYTINGFAQALQSSHDGAHEICGDGWRGFRRRVWLSAWSAEGGVVLSHVDLECYFSRLHGGPNCLYEIQSIGLKEFENGMTKDVLLDLVKGVTRVTRDQRKQPELEERAGKDTNRFGAFLIACPSSRLLLGPFGEKAEYMGLGRSPSDRALLVGLVDG